jgi:hypothetical protein
MAADQTVLAELVTLAGLVAGAAMYSITIRRRAERRLLDVQRAAQDSGLQGLVRVFLADPRT